MPKPRIDARIGPHGDIVLISPHWPNFEYTVKRDDGTDESGIVWACTEFVKLLESRPARERGVVHADE